MFAPALRNSFSSLQTKQEGTRTLSYTDDVLQQEQRYQKLSPSNEEIRLERPRLQFIMWLHKRREEERAQQSLPKVAIVTTTSIDAESFSREFMPWLLYHVNLGVSKLYLFYDGSDPHVIE